MKNAFGNSWNFLHHNLVKCKIKDSKPFSRRCLADALGILMKVFPKQSQDLSQVLSLCNSLSTKKTFLSSSISSAQSSNLIQQFWTQINMYYAKKSKGFRYSLLSVGPGADPGLQAVSPQVTISHPPGNRLPLLSSRPVVTLPAAEHHRPLAGMHYVCIKYSTAIVTSLKRC